MVIIVPGKLIWSAIIIDPCCLPVHTVHPDMVFIRIPDIAQKVVISIMYMTDHKIYFFLWHVLVTVGLPLCDKNKFQSHKWLNIWMSSSFQVPSCFFWGLQDFVKYFTHVFVMSGSLLPLNMCLCCFKIYAVCFSFALSQSALCARLFIKILSDITTWLPFHTFLSSLPVSTLVFNH